MSAPSDEAAGSAAADLGEAQRMAPSRRLFAYEPAASRWRYPPSILFHEPAPTCERCGQRVLWGGPPERTDRGYVYRLVCLPCDIADELVIPFRLCMGGDNAWWNDSSEGRELMRSFGWREDGEPPIVREDSMGI